jgi:RimJ/RimL family protein N-acetyltransferase
MNYQSIFENLSHLRSESKFNEASILVVENLKSHPHYQKIVFENNPIFWSDIRAGVCILTRRNSRDIEFLRRLWLDREFMFKFHRQMPELPDSDKELNQILDAEYFSVLSESNTLHWIVRDKKLNPWGLISLTDISLINRRGEVLIGVLSNAPLGLATAAMLMIFEFFFKVMKFNKLTSYVYEDNNYSFKSTLHLGFKIEGKLINHVIDPESGNFYSLNVFGLMAKDAFNPRNLALMKRLLVNK